MKKKIAISETRFMCDKDDLKAQKNCPFYDNDPNLDTDIKGLCIHNSCTYGYDEADCCCDEAIEVYISRGFVG